MENTDSWTWFLRLLLKSIENVDHPYIPLISDFQKGLKAAIQEVFPGKVHGCCAHHLKANVKKTMGRLLRSFFGATSTHTRDIEITVTFSLLLFAHFSLY